MIRPLRPIPTLVLAAILATVTHGASQTTPAAEPARVLVLGTFHFANPGLDVVQHEVADVLSPARQTEIEEITAALGRFLPTRVVVEHLPAAAAQLDSLYAAYREGSHSLSRNETQQLGFRLAAAHGLARVEPFDHGGEFPFGEVMAYAAAHDPPFVAEVETAIARIAAESGRQQRELTLAQILRGANDPDKLRDDHAMYIRFARVGAGESQVGATLLARWYERNIRMFSNLQSIAGPGDRVLVIVGSGHAPILRELIRSDAAMELEDPLAYLP
jgi:hypothetical protein